MIEVGRFFGYGNNEGLASEPFFKRRFAGSNLGVSSRKLLLLKVFVSTVLINLWFTTSNSRFGVYALTEVGCFSSLPSSFGDGSTYEFQSSAHCASECSGSQYMALYNHDECFCGDDDPSESSSTSSSCNAYCYGYGSEMCGGENAYLVYALSDSTSSGGSSSSTSSSSSSSSSTSSSSNPGTTTTLDGTSSADSSTQASITSSPSAETDGSNSSGDDEPSVVYSTSIKTVSGSVQYVTTNIVTASSTSGSSSSNNNSNSSSSKKTQVGPIVGGVVGGVVGLVLVVLAVIFTLRHISRRREDERMEKEYQEAIKPVDYDEHRDNYFTSSASDYMHPGDSDGSGNGHGLDTSMATATTAGAAGAGLGRTPSSGIPLSESQGTVSNPFADSKRTSNGSLFDSSDLHHEQQNKLTVVNPDE